MSFDVPAEAYGQFMGRYSEPLAAAFLAGVAVPPGGTALDVGCGPGALTVLLAERLGPAAVAAVDPSESFVSALRHRLPAVDARVAGAEELPFADDLFDAALAGLVLHFLPDPVAGLTEMARVTRPGGVVAASTWDFAGRRDPLAIYRAAARQLGLAGSDESQSPGARQGHLAELFHAAGLRDIQPSELTVEVRSASFEDWWHPLTLGVGPAGAHIAGLDELTRGRLRERCAQLLPPGPVTIRATAWTCSGRV